MSRRDFTAVRDKFANDDGLPFGRLLTREYVLGVLAIEGHRYRNRVFCPLVTLWGWLSQSLSQDKSLNEAVSRVLAHRVATGLPSCSASSAAYTKARTRFPEAVMERMAKEIGRRVHASADNAWNWRGRPVFLADGTGFSMPDTPENQLAYPQVKNVAPGLGFPLMRAVALISLSTGAVVDLAFTKFAGKNTGESALLRRMMGSMKPGSILVADRYYPSFWTVALLYRRGVDMVSVAHNSRGAVFTQGEKLGPLDHIATWKKPEKRPKWMDAQTYAGMPDTVRVREFAIDTTDRDGNPTRAVVVSTMTDPRIPKSELSDLYWARWNCELDLRSIKCSMNMGILRAKTPAMVHKEIWCHILAYNLLRGTMTEAAKRNDATPRQLSVKGAMQAVESFTPAMMATNRGDVLYHAFLQTVSAHHVANRPGTARATAKEAAAIVGPVPDDPASLVAATAGRASDGSFPVRAACILCRFADTISAMYDVRAVANWFLNRSKASNDELTAMKLQKLAYVGHGWHLAYSGPLVHDAVEAWQWGPVFRSLYHEFRDFGSEPITRLATAFDGSSLEERLIQLDDYGPPLEPDATKRFLEEVWKVYGGYSAAQLSDITHRPGTPWSQVIQQMGGKIRPFAVIPNTLIAEHYKKLLHERSGT